MRIYFSSARAFTIMLGLLVAFIALAVKDLIIDVVAYLYISLRKPFSVGQVVEIEGVVGELVDIDFLQFNLLEMGEMTDNKTHTGRYISMPNRFIFDHPVFNYNHTNPFVFVDVSMVVGFEEDREECLRLAGKVAYEKFVEMKERYKDKEEKDLEKFRIAMKSYGERIRPRLRAELATSGFEIFIQFYTAFDEIGKNKMIMQNALYDEFVKHDIDMPTPKVIHLD